MELWRNEMEYLKKYVKIRKEEDYVLLCDCSTIQNYELPSDTFCLLKKLQTGYDTSKPIGIKNEQELIKDLKELELIDNVPNSNKGFHDKPWISLEYDESEFF
jgi:hypothetical protein